MKLVNTLDCGSSIRGFESLQPPVKNENRRKCGFLFFRPLYHEELQEDPSKPSLIVISHEVFVNVTERIITAKNSFIMNSQEVRLPEKRAEPGKENSEKCLLFIILIIASPAEYV